MLYNINEEDLKKCQDFADKVFESNKKKYASRGQANGKLIKEQIVLGKLAELAVSKLLPGCNEPDFEIYKGKKKSFDCDLSNNTDKIHVKSMSVETSLKFGLSWTFQYSDKGYDMDPLLTRQDPQDRIVFTLVDITNKVVQIKQNLKANMCINLIKLPVLRHLWNSKRVIYWDDIKDLKDEK